MVGAQASATRCEPPGSVAMGHTLPPYMSRIARSWGTSRVHNPPKISAGQSMNTPEFEAINAPIF